MKILISNEINHQFVERLQSEGYKCDFRSIKDENDLLQIISNYDGLIVRGKPNINEQVFKFGTKLRFVARYGSGVEHIDLHSANKYNVEIIRAPEALAPAVAEFCVGSLINILRNISLSTACTSSGNWERDLYRGMELNGKTVGIIGYGNTGSYFANVLRSFQVRVLAYDPYKDEFNNDYVLKAELRDLYEKADIISFHVPLTNETEYFADFNFFRNFKKPIILINTSRGKVVDTTALVDAMKTDKIIGAVLDVLELEGKEYKVSLLKKDNKLANSIYYLIGHPKVLLTPHIAGWSDRSLDLIQQILFEKICKLSQN